MANQCRQLHHGSWTSVIIPSHKYPYLKYLSYPYPSKQNIVTYFNAIGKPGRSTTDLNTCKVIDKNNFHFQFSRKKSVYLIKSRWCADVVCIINCHLYVLLVMFAMSTCYVRVYMVVCHLREFA